MEKKQEFSINKHFFQKQSRIDISEFIEDGANVVNFNPAICPYKAYVELVEAYHKESSFIKEDEINDD